jgi:hypothetical protein
VLPIFVLKLKAAEGVQRFGIYEGKADTTPTDNPGSFRDRSGELDHAVDHGLFAAGWRSLDLVSHWFSRLIDLRISALHHAEGPLQSAEQVGPVERAMPPACR